MNDASSTVRVPGSGGTSSHYDAAPMRMVTLDGGGPKRDAGFADAYDGGLTGAGPRDAGPRDAVAELHEFECPHVSDAATCVCEPATVEWRQQLKCSTPSCARTTDLLVWTDGTVLVFEDPDPNDPDAYVTCAPFDSSGNPGSTSELWGCGAGPGVTLPRTANLHVLAATNDVSMVRSYVGPSTATFCHQYYPVSGSIPLGNSYLGPFDWTKQNGDAVDTTFDGSSVIIVTTKGFDAAQRATLVKTTSRTPSPWPGIALQLDSETVLPGREAASRAVAAGTAGRIYWFVTIFGAAAATNSIFTVSADGGVLGQSPPIKPLSDVDMVADIADNLYVAGASPLANGLVELFVSKRDPLGNVLWTWEGSHERRRTTEFGWLSKATRSSSSGLRTGRRPTAGLARRSSIDSRPRARFAPSRRYRESLPPTWRLLSTAIRS